MSGKPKRVWDMTYRVELQDGRVWLVKCDKVQVDGRRVYFLSSEDRIIRSWLLTNVESWEAC